MDSAIDHDLLVRVDEKLAGLRADFSSFRDGVSSALGLKADRDDVVRIEGVATKLGERVSAAERLLWQGLGAIGLIEVACGIAIAIHYLRA